LLFDQIGTLARTSALDFGVALLLDFVTGESFENGRHIRVFPTCVETPGRYSLVWPSLRPPNHALIT